MFRRKNESFDDYEKRMNNRADILFTTMKNNDKSSAEGTKKPKNLPLGKLIFDEADFA